MTRHNLVTLFARQLECDPDGRYWLRTPAEQGMIAVEDLPFVAIAAEVTADAITVTTNCDDRVTVSASHPLRLDDMEGQLQPAVHVRGNLWARVARSVYYDLVAQACPDPAGTGLRGVTSAGTFFALERQGEVAA